jgi:hypothetical protein
MIQVARSMGKRTSILLLAVLSACFCVRGQTTVRRWVTTYEFKGAGRVQTEPIRFWDTKWRVNYQPKGDGPFEILIRDLSTNKYHKITHQRSGKPIGGQVGGSGAIKDACLVVRGSDEGWHIVISQDLDRVDEWEYRQRKRPASLTLPFGSWSGAAGDHEFSFELSDARSCVRAVQRRVGYLRVEIEDANGATVSRTVSTKVGESESWLYAPGTYKARISAVGTEWNLHVETLDEGTKPEVKDGK